MEPAARLAPRRDQGFTLVEVLMALLILAIVALGIAGMFSHSMLVNASGYDYAKLASQARFVLEELRARPFTDPTLDDTAGATRTWVPAGGDNYSNRGFTAVYAVTDFSLVTWNDVTANPWPVPPAGTMGTVKRITITVTSTAQNLQGNRVLTVSGMKVRGL
jgi:prepilin-type N-terminal cleavage/methylation domain-containing protein